MTLSQANKLQATVVTFVFTASLMAQLITIAQHEQQLAFDIPESFKNFIKYGCTRPGRGGGRAQERL